MEDWRQELVKEEGLKRVADAKRLFGQAIRKQSYDSEAAHQAMREAISTAASAFYWLDDTDLGEPAHQTLHKYGKYARQHFPKGCTVDFDGRHYLTRCPVLIAHKRFGFSVEFEGTPRCSLCGDDASECMAHTKGEKYDVAGGWVQGLHGSWCRICGASSCDAHSSGETYTVRAGHVIEEANLLAAALVPKPRQPDARLSSLEIDDALMLPVVGRDNWGDPIGCTRCELPCQGFTEMPKRLNDPA